MSQQRLPYIPRTGEQQRITSALGDEATLNRGHNSDRFGVAVAVDPLGLLVLESPTGMLERLSPVTVLRVDRVDPD